MPKKEADPKGLDRPKQTKVCTFLILLKSGHPKI